MDKMTGNIQFSRQQVASLLGVATCFLCLRRYTLSQKVGGAVVVYVDTLFALNGFVNYLLLLATARLSGQPMVRWRLWLAAALGGFYAVGCVVPGWEILTMVTVKILVMAVMTMVAFGWRMELLKEGLLFFGLSCGFAGLVYGVVQVFGTGFLVLGGHIYYPVSAGALIVMAAAVYLTCKIIFTGLGQRHPGELMPLEITHGAVTIHMTALYDTGNSLKDPITNRGVIIVDWHAAKELFPSFVEQDDVAEPVTFLTKWKEPGWRLLPYGAVGVSCGMLLAKTCDTLVVGQTKIKKGLVAFSPTAVSGTGAYQALIGGKLK